MGTRASRSIAQLVDDSLRSANAEQLAEIERRVRAPLESLLRDLAEKITDVVAGAPEPADDPVLSDFNQLLHALRTAELGELSVRGGTLLSAGCAGAWYFDWLEQCAGPFERHIGVELYAAEPARLPPQVTWIAESASSMPGVESSSVDVVFSGQNVEHLWSDDMVGFLLEANRVLRHGGTLVMDSPNRLATEALGWVHPEHTIELSADEIQELLRLAGFRPDVVRGLWRVRDERGWLPLAPQSGEARELIARAAGRLSPDDAFVWWIEAEKVAEPVAVERLHDAVTGLFDQHWTPRVNRAAGGTVPVPVGQVGLVYSTHAFPIFAGEYEVTAPDPRLRVVLHTLDGRELPATGSLDRAELGVRAAVFLDEAVEERIEALDVTVDLRPISAR